MNKVVAKEVIERESNTTDPLYKGSPASVDTAAQKIFNLLQANEKPAEPESTEVAEEVPDTEVEAEPETPEAVETPTEEARVTHFGELSDHLNVDEDYLLSLTVDAKVNGQSRSPTIKDLIANYQKGESADMKLMEAAEVRKKYESEIAAEKEKLQEDRNRILALQTELENLLSGDDSELEVLRQADPAEYNARLNDRQLRIQRVEKVKQQMLLENLQKRNEEYSRVIASEQPKLMTAIPEWQDEKVRNTEAVKLRQYLLDQGFRDYEIDGQFENGFVKHPGITDHRAFVIARKAWLYDQIKTGSAPKKEKLQSLPKVGTGKKVSASDAKKSEIQARREQLKQSGNVKDAAAYIFARINKGN